MQHSPNRLLSNGSVEATDRCLNARFLTAPANDSQVTHQLQELPSEIRRKIIGPKVDKKKRCRVCQLRALASFSAQGAHRQIQFFPCENQAHVHSLGKFHPGRQGSESTLTPFLYPTPSTSPPSHGAGRPRSYSSITKVNLFCTPGTSTAWPSIMRGLYLNFSAACREGR